MPSPVVAYGQYNSVPPALLNQESVPLQVDSAGNVLVNLAGNNVSEITAAWTSATAGNTALTMTVLGYTSVIVTLNQGTTITGGAVSFEVSDTTAFTNAYVVNASPMGTSGGASSPRTVQALAASTNSSFEIPVAGWAAVRVRLSTVITGTATVNVGLAASAAPYSPSLVAIAAAALSVISQNAAAALADNQINETFFASSGAVNDPLAVGDWVYGGAFSGAADAVRQGWSKKRVPTVFKTVQATASGDTAIWTPGTGNKWRLLRVLVQLTENASLAAGAVLTILLRDATTATGIAFDVFVPTTAVTTTVGDGLEQELDLGDFGILSAAANNALNVNLSAALATGTIRIIAMGTEE